MPSSSRANSNPFAKVNHTVLVVVAIVAAVYMFPPSFKLEGSAANPSTSWNMAQHHGTGVDENSDGKITSRELTLYMGDLDGSGHLDASETRNLAASESHPEDLHAAADKDQDGHLSFEEFASIMSHPAMPQPVGADVASLDTNGDGKVDMGEVMGELHAQKSAHRYVALILGLVLLLGGLLALAVNPTLLTGGGEDSRGPSSKADSRPQTLQALEQTKTTLQERHEILSVSAAQAYADNNHEKATELMQKTVEVAAKIEKKAVELDKACFGNTLWKMIDTESDGKLHKFTFKKNLKKLPKDLLEGLHHGRKFSTTWANKCFNEIDTDENDSIDHDEFVNWVVNFDEGDIEHLDEKLTRTQTGSRYQSVSPGK